MDRRRAPAWRWLAGGMVAVAAVAFSAVASTTAHADTGCGIGYAYDAAGRLVGVSDQGGQTASYRYDEPSQTVFNNGTLRVDVENPVPGRPGASNIHVQFMGRGADPIKYYYNASDGTWVSESGTVLPSRVASQIPQSAINRAFQYLGITP
jgi:hypothetical protein